MHCFTNLQWRGNSEMVFCRKAVWVVHLNQNFYISSGFLYPRFLNKPETGNQSVCLHVNLSVLIFSGISWLLSATLPNRIGDKKKKVPISTKEMSGWARETDLNECPHCGARRWWELECNLPSVGCQLADEHEHSWEQTQHELPLVLALVR